ncbi:hypothetical protein Asp14428_19410 [Actinoplanes sp. NBRC 14428]|nr:hypothetical protein Asp14428_19410 [Actinoplanes sp. NBRC 14428]
MSASRMRSRPVSAIFSAALFALASLTGAAAGSPVPKMVADVAVTATVLNDHQVRVDWTTTLNPSPGSWTVGRDGFDTLGSGPWSTSVSGSVRTWTFNSLITGQQYTFTVTPAGSTDGSTATATPGDPNPPSGVTVTATVLNENQVKVDWTSTLSPQPASWTVGRDGFDNRGSGPWSTSVSGSVRTWTFNSLITGQQYTFTVTPAGSTRGFTATATPGGTAPPPGGTAQETQGWGTPVWQDDFNGTAVGSQWNLYTDPGSQHGNRQPSQCQVSGGTLKLVSLPDRRTCGMSHDRDQTHGRWEARVRTSGAGWKSLFIIWPESDEWNDGEYDWMEQTAGGNCYGGFMHYPGDPRRQEVLPQNSASCVGSTQWHHVAFEWTATSLKGWIDGRLWYTIPAMGTLTRMPAGHVTIQQDDQGSGSGNSALQEVDWIKGWDL